MNYRIGLSLLISILNPSKKPTKKRRKFVKVRESIPDWLDEIGSSELGKEWEEELHALNQPASCSLAYQYPQNHNNAELRQLLASQGIFNQSSSQIS
jgi:16S rRNA C967 or C1407 C5-methylase (RsmB/RsmF family)